MALDAHLRAFKLGKGKPRDAPPLSVLLKQVAKEEESCKNRKVGFEDESDDPYVTFDDVHLIPEKHKRIETHNWEEQLDEEQQNESGGESEVESQKVDAKSSNETIGRNVVKKFDPKTGKTEFVFTGEVSDMEEQVKSNIEKAIERAKDNELLDFKVTE